MHQVFDAIDTHPPASSATEADWERLRQAFEPSGSQTTVTNGIRASDEMRAHMGLQPGEEIEVDEFGQPSERMRQRWFESTGSIPALTPAQGRELMQSFREAQDMNTGQ